MKTILVGTDFTDKSKRALNLAVELARSLKARIHLVHVVEPIEDPDEADAESAQFHAELQEKAREKLSQLLAELKDVNVGGTVLLGHRSPALLQEAEREDAYLVVLGLRIPKEGEPPVPGVSHRVSWNASKPVLLVP